MPSLLLIRHGQASYGGADYDVLSPRGTEQAAAVHQALAGVGITPARLFSGSMRRQLDSATPWAAAYGRPEVDPRWNEYDAGDVLRAHSPAAASLERPVGPDGEPLSSRDFQGLLDEALLAWIAAGSSSSAGEPWPGFRGRVTAAAREAMAALDSGQTGLVFTSGGVIAAVAAALLDLPDSALVALNHVAINGAFSKLVGGRRGITLVSFNEHAHLAEPLVTYR